MSVSEAGWADRKWLAGVTLAGCEQARHMGRAYETMVPSTHFYDILTQNATLNRPFPDRLSYSPQL